MGGVDGAVETVTVDQLMAEHPETMPVLNAFGVDTCCGAHRSVREAALEDGVEWPALEAALTKAMEGR